MEQEHLHPSAGEGEAESRMCEVEIGGVGECTFLRLLAKTAALIWKLGCSQGQRCDICECYLLLKRECSSEG